MTTGELGDVFIEWLLRIAQHPSSTQADMINVAGAAANLAAARQALAHYAPQPDPLTEAHEEIQSLQERIDQLTITR